MTEPVGSTSDRCDNMDDGIRGPMPHLALQGRRCTAAATLALAMVAGAAPARAAQAAAPAGPTAAEIATLGRQHAAEHDAERYLQHEDSVRWHRLSPARR